MNTHFSILHISDLHRISEEAIDCIISSFQLEKDEYRKLGIPPVKLIIVSGDIINGSKNEDPIKAKEEIQHQYDVAKKFLIALTEEFIGRRESDRLKVIMVPGNHDMSRYISRESMETIDNDDIDKLVTALWSDNSKIRWSWKNLQFHHIKYTEIYNHRFDDFAEFYNDFYLGQRLFPTEIDAQSDLIDFPDLNMSIACFNSCYQLDHLRMNGYISPKSLSRLTRSLIEAKNKGRLIAAVWHHHTHGLPNESNYLDYTILDNMTQNGIYLAFHGHQHVSGILNERKDIFSDAKLTMVSAGTLYGNSSDIPLGLTRQYNIVEVSMNDDKCVLTLYSREDKTSLNVMPAWDSGFIGRSRTNCFDIHVQLTPCIEKRPDEKLQDEINKVNLYAEQTQDFKTAILKLKDLGIDKPLVRKFILDISSRIEDYTTIKELYQEPLTTEEAFAVVEGCTKTKDVVTFKRVCKSTFVVDSKDPSLRALIDDAKIQLHI